MLKLAGCIMIVISTTAVFSSKILKAYFTYRFMAEIADVSEKIIYESETNMPYDFILRKIGFDKSAYLKKAQTNHYIKNSEYKRVEAFISDLGKRDKNAEKQYLRYNLDSINHIMNIYFNEYRQNSKIYVMCGAAVGLLIVIFII